MSVLSTAATALGAGEWCILTTNNWVEGFIRTPDQTTGTCILDYGGNLCWDPINKWMLYYNFGGHNEGNRHIIRYAENTGGGATANTWDYYYVHTGETFHAYDQVAITPDTGRLWFWDIANDGKLLEFTGSGFTQRKGATGAPEYSIGSMDYFPENAAFYGNNQGGLYKCTRPGYVVSDIEVDYPYHGQGYHTGAVYCPVTKKMVLYGNDTNIVVIMAENETLTESTAPIATVDMPNHTLTACPVTGDLLLVSHTGGFYKMNSATGVWSAALSNPYAVKGGGDVDGAWVTAAGPISDYGVIMFAQWHTSGHRVLLYKHAASVANPLIGTANATYAVTDDFNGTLRSTLFDVGCYET